MNAKIHHSAGRRAVVVLSVALAMLVAACGGSSSDNTTRDDVIALAEASFSADVGLEELPESLKTFVACAVDAVVEELDLSWSDVERALEESGDLNSLTSDTDEMSPAGLECLGELTFEDLVLIGGGSDDDLFGSGASSYGDDPELDALWDACEAGDDVACDDLYWESPLGSEYESFAQENGGASGGLFGSDPSEFRSDCASGDVFACVDLFLAASDADDEQLALDGLRGECAGDDMFACDLLYLYSPFGSDDQEFGATCGGRTDGSTANSCERE